MVVSFFPPSSADLPVYSLQVWNEQESFVTLRTSSSLQECWWHVQMTDYVRFRPLFISAIQN